MSGPADGRAMSMALPRRAWSFSASSGLTSNPYIVGPLNFSVFANVLMEIT